MTISSRTIPRPRRAVARLLRWGARGTLALGVILTATPSSAQQDTQPSAADLESARELYREGKDLRAKGDIRSALEKFKAAHGYGQTPVTGVELGKTHMQLGELIEAREVLLSIARLKVAADETEKSTAARNEAADLAEQLRPRIPTLVVKVIGVKPDALAQVAVDGANAPVVSLSSMRKVNPGEHAVVVHVSGREEKRSITVGEGETKDVPVEFNDASPKILIETAPSPTPAPKPLEPESRSIPVVTWVGLGVGVAGIALGSVTGVLALAKASNVSSACRGLSCPPASKRDVDDGRTFANISTVGFVVGAVGVAAAAVTFFVFSPSSKKVAQATNVRLALSPTWAGIHADF